jgi:hypothetical protein
MKMNKLILLAILVLVFFYQPAKSQSVRPFLTIEGSIAAYLEQKYSRQYGVSVESFDTLLAVVKDAITDEEFEDPYGTLSGKMFFVAWGDSADEGRNVEGKEVFGFFYNGSVLWDSGPLCTSWGTHVIGSSDLNKDGEVDVLIGVRDAEEGRDYLSYLWIFSWNGTRARILNDVNPQTGQSVLLSGDDWYQLFDREGDGIMEIWAFWDKQNALFPDTLMNTRPYVTYSYNGSLYGLWSNTTQIPSRTFLANNRLIVKASCRVVQNGSSLEYYYRWLNDSGSVQKIRSIFLENVNQDALAVSPSGWLSLLPTKPFSGILWDLEDSQKCRMIKAGQSREGFELQDTCLPIIIRYFVKGYAPSSTLWDDEPEHTQEEIRNDFLTNSIIGFTVAPSIAPLPFVPLNFLDTLPSFTTRSRDLAWIKQQSTADKYLGYFTVAKTALQQNNIQGTRTALTNTLHDLNIDSSSTLTSEAYALLRYNTEYLLKQLPIPSSGLNVKLINSTGNRLFSGALQYYEGSWKDAVNNNDGAFTIITNQKTTSLRMTYEYGTQTKSNITIGSDTVIFQTINAQILLQDSKGNPIDTGTVQYYAGAWRNFGTTTNGIATKELLPGNYTFRMMYAYASKDKQQDLGTNAAVIFQTVNVNVQLQNSKRSLMDQGIVQYYSGAWRNFGATTNGIATKELLPGNYTFRMTYGYASKDKQQDIGTNPTVVFQTVNAAVQLQNSQGNLIGQYAGGGTVQYYSGAWRDFGVTINGVATKELLPNTYSFRMTYAFASKDKQQDLSSNLTVVFQTVNAVVQLQNSQGTLIDQGSVQYYSGAWRDFGTTTNGVTTKELLPNTYSFRMTYAFASKDKQQDLSSNPTVVFQTVNAAVQLQNSQGTLIDQGSVQYYSGAWRDFGTTTNGVATKELLPNTYSFRMAYAFASKDKQQDLSSNPTVVFQTVKANVQLQNSQGILIDQGTVQYYSGAWRDFGTTTNGLVTKELLPNSYTFKMSYEFVSNDKVQDILANTIVNFSTVLCTIRVKNSQNEPVNNVQTSYYSGAWRQIGMTVNGEVTKELLPANLTFRIKSGTTQVDKIQNLSTNNIVEFSIQQ